MVLFLLAACSFEHLAFLDPYIELSASTTAVDFGAVAYGVTAADTVHFDNAGTTPAQVALAVEPPFSLDQVEVLVPAAGSASVMVSFSPLAAGDVSSELTAALQAGSGFAIALAGALNPDGDGDGAEHALAGGDDCDDTDASIGPGASEVWYDGVDQDCDGNDADADGDGFGAVEAGGDDFEDQVADAYPGAVEVWYDNVDGDCDGEDDFDADGDGFVSDAFGGDDCDDENPRVSPGDDEVWYDGVDQDCDGANDYDADADGDRASAHGGADCDDSDPTRYGTAAELDDTVDQDCDELVDEDFVGVGDIVLSELMLDPSAASDASGQYVELVNVSDRTAVLQGWTVAGTPVDDELLLEPGARALVCATVNSADNGGLSCDWGWDRAWQLDSEEDELSLELDGVVIDVVAWGPAWAAPEGASLELGPEDATDNDDPSSWCDAVSTSVTGDLGTPGTPNDCPG